MLRADINRLAELIEACDDIEMISIFNTPNHGPNANRVVTSTAFSMDRDVYKDSCGFPFSAGVDIFVLDYVPRDKALEEEMVEALQVCATAAHERLFREGKGSAVFYHSDKRSWNRIIDKTSNKRVARGII